LLSHAPITKPAQYKSKLKEGQFTQSGGGGEEYIDRAESQKELNNLVDMCFKDKTKLNFEDFKKITESVTSEMFLCMFSIIKTNLPSIVQFKRYEQGLKKKSDPLLRSPSQSKRIASPKVLSKFSTLSNIVKFSTPKAEHSVIRVAKSSEPESTEESKGATPPQKALSKFGPKPKSSFAPAPNEVNSPIGPVIRHPKPKEPTPSTLGADTALFCECGKNIVDFNKLLCADCIRQLNESKCEGYLWKVGKKHTKKYWVVIEKRDLFCYEKKEAPVHKSMTSLVGYFPKEEPTEKIEGQTMYVFSLALSATQTKKYAVATKEEYQSWINYIKKAVGFASLLDFYELKVYEEVKINRKT
jgi:hypothetical protein